MVGWWERKRDQLAEARVRTRKSSKQNLKNAPTTARETASKFIKCLRTFEIRVKSGSVG